MINFISFIAGLLTFSHFSSLYLVLFCLVTLILYQACHYFNFIKIQILVAYLYGGIATGLILRLGICFWISKNYHLFIVLPIIAVIPIIVYAEFIQRRYSLTPISYLEGEELMPRMYMSSRTINHVFQHPESLIGLDLNKIGDLLGFHHSGGDDGRGGYGAFFWETKQLRGEIETLSSHCIKVVVTKLPLPNIATCIQRNKNNELITKTELRCESGQICPRSGMWINSLNQVGTYLAQGEEMPEIRSEWEKVYWLLHDNEFQPIMNYIIHAKEAYLLEQFSSLHFFEVMRSHHRLFLNVLEELFEIYMNNLPYNLRDLPLPEQADINWGGTVFPNLRGTMDRIDYAYIKIKAGDFTYLGIVGEVGSNDKGLREFSKQWMDDLPYDKVRQCWDYYSITNQYASVIRNTYRTNWDIGFLENEFPDAEIFDGIDVPSLPSSYPIYRINSKINIRSKSKLTKTGIYVCQEYDNKLAFLASSVEDDNGFAPRYAKQNTETGENMYFETTWMLVERVADGGCSTD